MVAAAVAAGLPAGLLYAVAAYLLALPPLLEAEAVEAGGPVATGVARLLGGLAGGVGLGCALALVLTPIVRAVGPKGWRAGAAVGALAFLGLFLLPALVTRPGPPGLDHPGGMGLRQAAWLLSVLLFVAAWGIGARVRRALGPGWRAVLGGLAAGAATWGLGMALFLRLTGYAPGAESGPVPADLALRFRVATALANACLFAALAVLIPRALRRFGP